MPLATCLLLFIVACSGQGGIRPLAPTIVPNQVVASQPQLVTFTELEEDPTVYQDKVIRVTGSYLSLPVVACTPHSGPQSSWALVAEDLRLDMLGFEGLLNQLAPQDLTLTLDGVLRRYDGPLGCGKRPAASVLWYLEVFQIIQPNPLVQAGTGSSGGTAVVPPPFSTATGIPGEPDSEETPEIEATTGAGTPTRTPSPTTSVIPTASSTPTINPDGSVTPAGTTTVTRTPTRTPTPITGPGGTASPTPSRTPTAGATSAPLPTATPNGYPGPVPTSVPPPTSLPTPYP